MDLTERIKQRHRMARENIMPAMSSDVDIAPKKKVDDGTVENLLLYTALEYSHYRGQLNSSKRRKELIQWLGIDYRKNGSDIYIVSTNIDSFLLEKDGLYYPFDKTDIQVPLKFRNDEVQIMEPAKIKTPPYEHPFVFSDGDICYGDLNFSEKIGVHFSHYYEINGMRSVARKISKVLTEGERVIEKGYFGNRIIPLHDIDEFSCVASNRRDAERYATRNRISLDRIIHN